MPLPLSIATDTRVDPLQKLRHARLPLLGVFALGLFCHPSVLQAQASRVGHADESILWYRKPAPIWDHALSVGNGRLGAMVFGGANTSANNGDVQDAAKNAELLNGEHTSATDEHLQLNESTVWHGARADRLNPQAHGAVPRIRQLLLGSKGLDGAMIRSAEKLADQDMIAVPPAMPGYSSLGDLYLRGAHGSEVTQYRRQLDMSTGVVQVTYISKHVRYTREIFASLPDQVIVMRLTADRPRQISFRASMDRPADYSIRTAGSNRLILREGPDHKDQIRFAGEVLVLPRGGTLRAQGKEVVVEAADSVVVLIAAATDFKGGPFAGGDPERQCDQVLARARTKSFDSLLSAHIADHSALFRRTVLHLGAAADPFSELPTDERLKRVTEGADDLHLQELYFQFARYLLISSSRAGGLPANLQGLWAAGIENPWGSKWTINVNTEMNYWLAEPADLGETTTPLFTLLDMLRTPGSGTGQRVAQEYYNARGFVAHHNTDIWGDAEPIDGIQSGVWPMGAAWLSLYTWDHYAYTGDVHFLRARAWPVLHDASLFFLDYLVPDGSGHLVTGPSLSPENQYRLGDGTTHSLCMGPTMDIEIVRELFTRTLQAAQILHEDPAFIMEVQQASSKLPPFKVGRLGQLQEWQLDYDENDPGHRHISHLWALFPGTQLSLRDTPDLARAARISLERRLSHGGGQTGWSRAWVVNYWDHLHDGEQAYDSLQVLFKQSTFPNLMDTHPPGLFQIDGNLGAAAGMLEALLQSRWKPEASEIDFLPALPKAWSQGSVTDVRVRGGASVDLSWRAGKAVQAVIHPTVNAHLRLFAPEGQTISSISETSGAPLELSKNGTLAVHGGTAVIVRFQ